MNGEPLTGHGGLPVSVSEGLKLPAVDDHGAADGRDVSFGSWQSDGGSDELPEPAVLAREAMTELEGAFEELRGILAELGEEVEA